MNQKKFLINDGELEVWGIATKILKDTPNSFDELNISFKATVSNLSQNSDDVSIYIQAIDDEGFELELINLMGTVPVGTTKTLTSSELIDIELYQQVKEWRVQ